MTMTWAYHGPISDHGHTPGVSWAYIGRIIYLGHILGKTRAYLEHNLIDVTLACEDANSKLVEVVIVADIDAEGHVGNSLLG